MEEPTEPAFSHVIQTVSSKKRIGMIQSHPHIERMVQVRVALLCCPSPLGA